jgi:hypothetical protein
LPRTRTWIIDCVVLFLLTAVLIGPYFRLNYTSVWSSIESTFIADARMLNEPGTQGQWQPVWYAGTRSVYLYPPALRYGTAFIARVLSTTTAHAYHLYVSVLYCVGALAVYLLIRTGNGSRPWAWAGTAAVLLLSPIFLLMSEYRIDSGHLVPHRLNVLVRYGEGPHISSLCLLPLCFAAAILAFRHRRLWWIALSAVACALVVSNNFYGATALAILFPLLVWAYLIHDGGKDIIVRGAGIAVLAYCLTAFWLVPSYMKVTRDNLKLVAETGNTWSIVVFPFIVAAYAYITWRLRHRDPYRIWVYSSLFFMSWYILGHRWLGFQIAGQSARLAPEFDLVIILAAVELFRSIYGKSRGVALFLVFIAFLPSIRYLKHAWEIFPEDRNWQSSPEYQSARWVADNYPQDRVFATGSIRFWFNAWDSTSQIDGGSQQGILNPLLPAALYCLSHCTEPAHLSNWLKAFGVDLAVIPEKNSKETYHDVIAPEVWRKNFPLVHDDGKGNVFYRFDRRRRGVIRVVGATVAGLRPVTQDDFSVTLQPYADGISAQPPGGPDQGRLTYSRRSSDDFGTISADTVKGEAILVQETFDRAWQAYDRTLGGEQRLEIRRDPVGMMIIPVAPGKHSIHLLFKTPLEVYVGRVLAIVALGFVICSFFWRRLRTETSHPVS